MRFYTFFFAFLLLSASASAQTQLLRGPYLQAATDNSIHIRWRTDTAETGRVRWGTSAGTLSFIKDETAASAEHEIVLTGLAANTMYWYSVGSGATALQGNGDNYFKTLPSKGAKVPLRIGVIGDCGNNSVNQINVRNQLQNYLGSNYMNAWVLLGDNAYSYGLDAEYQATFFNIYQDKFLKQNPLYPSPGNHDYADNATLQNNHQMPYYDVFTMPVNGEAGGVPSNNEAYYSFDVGNVHFLSLDSYGQEDYATRLYDTLGKQVQWIKADLQANSNKDWVVAYWHHAPFSLGSRNGETDPEMTALRINFIRILERYGVDLILCGHSHDYERSRLQRGFYGYEAQFNPALHNLSTSSALYDGSTASCPYIKDTLTNAGTVYAVSGSAGQLGFASAGYPHDAMYYSNTSIGGSMILEVEGNRLDAKWICSDGVIRDRFTMMKNVSLRKAITINPGESTTLTASYNGAYSWTPGSATTKAITVSPSATTTYYVTDNYSCLRDTFTVTVNNVALPAVWGSISARYNKSANTVRLDWQTSQERDVLRFDVERSVDGTSFSTVGTTAARGTTSATTDYMFTDAGVDRNQAIYYYRIRQIDNTSATKLSPSVAVKLSGSPIVDVQVIPNPARPADMRIKLAAGEAMATLIVTDAAGKTMATKRLLLSATPQPFMPSVAKGSYFVQVQTDSGTTVVRVVVE